METTRLNIADEKFSKKKTLGFALLRLGNILAGLMIGEVTYFATNSLGIAAAAMGKGKAMDTCVNPDVDYTYTRFSGTKSVDERYGVGSLYYGVCNIA